MTQSVTNSVEPAKNDSVMMLIFSGSSDLPSGEKVEAALRNVLADLQSNLATDKAGPAAFFFPYNGFVCSIMSVIAPAPLGQEDPEFRNAWYWPTAFNDLSVHKSHVIISVSKDEENGIDRAKLMQKLLDTLLSVISNPIGVYNSMTGTLMQTALVKATLQQMEGSVSVPLFLSVAFARETDSAFAKPSISASTRGMDSFGLMNVEARGYPGSVQDLYQFLVNFTAYLILQRPDIRDGHSIGGSESEKITVRIQKSMYYPSSVYCLNFQ